MDQVSKQGLTRRGFVGGAAAAAAALGISRGALAGPASKATLQQHGFQDSASVITIGTLGEATSINPFLTNESEGDFRCKMMFEQFVRVNGQTYAPTPGPGIASNCGNHSGSIQNKSHSYNIDIAGNIAIYSLNFREAFLFPISEA